MTVMKILFYLRIVVMGGAERYLLMLLPELKKRNIEVGFFCTLQHDNQEIIQYFESQFIQHRIPVYICKASSPVSLVAARQLATIIIKEKYTILSAHLIHAEIISVLSKMIFRPPCKLVVTKHGYLQQFMDVHGLDPSKINRLNIPYLSERFLQRFVHSNFAVSKGLARFYVETGICKPEKIEVIYHGMDANVNEASLTPIQYSINQLLVVARLRKFKGHHFLIDALKIIAAEIPDVKLVILGKGEELGNLHRQVKENNLEQFVIFEGFSDNVYNYIKGSNLIVAPSIAEPFGLVVLEAYSCAKPVVAFDVTAFNENIADNETGCLARPYDIDDLALKIKYLLKNKSEAVQYGINGRALLQARFSLDESITKTIEFFSSRQ